MHIRIWLAVVALYYFAHGAQATDYRFSTRTRSADWWKSIIIYQIYPRSFQDSNGDGVGDIRGIISKLDHLKYLGVGAVWISPIYKSPMIDHGYDIEDFVDIDPVFGTLDDFDELIQEAHKKGLYIIMDYIPNHSSNLHKWFVESRKGGADNPYSDFYIWADGKVAEDGSRVSPNNWVSCFASDPWTWDEGRQQFYYHQFAVEQPDLNYRNPRVAEEMLKVLQFWLERGVDGFRVDAIGTMFEVEDLSLDEPRSFKPGVQPHEQFYYDHIYTRDLPEIHDVVRSWRKLFDEHDQKHGGHTFMVTEIFTNIEKTMKYYDSGADMPFNFNFIFESVLGCGGTCMRQLIDNWMNAMPAGKWPNFVTGNHDKNRISVRKGAQYVNALNVMLVTLPGTPTTYYGEELGMTDIDVSYAETQDPWGINLGPDLYREFSRDPCRSPMQWSSAENAGFSLAGVKTWLPVHPDYKTRNVETQKLDDNSSLQIYKRSVEARNLFALSPHIKFVVVDENILSYARYTKNCAHCKVFLIIVNMGTAGASHNYELTLDGRSYTTARVLLDSQWAKHTDLTVRLQKLELAVGQAAILQLIEDVSGGGEKDEL